MEVQRVGLHTVELSVCAYFGLPLVEVTLRARLAVELLDFVGSRIEQVAVVRFLV